MSISIIALKKWKQKLIVVKLIVIIALLAHDMCQAATITTTNVSEINEERANVYPDYCWYTGLENRILAEYPQLREQLQAHRQALSAHNWSEAVEWHRKMFAEIYRLALERASRDQQQLSESHTASINKKSSNIDPDTVAAYALYDLWANTPGDYAIGASEYDNYVTLYIVHSHVEFWAYYYDRHNGHAEAKQLLESLRLLAIQQELGPIELLQVSLNIMELINMYSADLVVDKLIGRSILDEQHYDQWLANCAKLLELSEDFHWAAYDYVHKQALDLDVKSSHSDTLDPDLMSSSPQAGSASPLAAAAANGDTALHGNTTAAATTTTTTTTTNKNNSDKSSVELPQERPDLRGALKARSLSAHVHSFIDTHLEHYLAQTIREFKR